MKATPFTPNTRFLGSTFYSRRWSKKLRFVLFILAAFCSGDVIAQYTPQADIRGGNDTNNGAKLQLATPSESHFLRLFSGDGSDPKPYLLFSDANNFRIASAKPDFTNFRNLLTVRGDGRVGIGTDEPVGRFHVQGPTWTNIAAEALTNDPSFQLTSDGSSINNDWTIRMDVSDGNRMQWRYGGVHVMDLTTGGDLILNSLGGAGDRNVIVDSNGKLKVGAATKYLSLTGASFHPESDNNSIEWNAGIGGAWFSAAPSDFLQMTAPLNLPHGSTIQKITVYYRDTDPGNDVEFRLYDIDNLTSSFGAIFTISSSGNTSFSSVSSTTSINIDNQRFGYSFAMIPKVAGTMDSDFRIYQVAIEYTEF